MDELRAAALAYGAAQEKYRAEYNRAPPKSEKRDGFTEVIWDEAQNAAVTALHEARSRMEKLAESMYAAAREEELRAAYGYCPRCNGHHERKGEAEEKCQEVSRFVNEDHRRRGGTV